MLLRKFRRWVLIGLAVFVSAQSLMLANPSTVSADGKDGSFISSELSGKVLDHQLYYYLASCFRSGGIDKIPKDELLNWGWLKHGRLGQSKQSRWRGAMYENNQVYCEDGQWLKEAFGRFGFTDPLSTFCSLEFAYNQSTGGIGKTVNGGDSKEACMSGLDAGDFDGSDGSDETDFQGDSVDRLLSTSSKYSAAKGALADDAEYLRYYRTFMRGCEVTLTQPYETGAATDKPNAYKVTVVNQDGTTEDWLGSGVQGDSVKVELVSTTGENPKEITCGQLAVGLRERASAYATYLKNSGEDDEPIDSTPGEGSDGPVCSAGALGWVLCPLSEALVGAIEGIANILKGLLIYQPLLNSQQGDAIKSIWQSLLVIANVGLVIAILVIVFSQATSIGLTSYGIKKLLPRVIAAAILMNLSFYICAVAVDISNILGVSIKGIVEAGLDRITDIASIDPDLQAGADATDWFVTITGAVLVTGIAAATGAIFLLVPVLIAGMMAMLTALVIIAARQVLITLLIIVAPIAFLAWILPNTEEWFTKWRKLFTALLLMFPLIMLIFYGSVLVSSVIMTASTNTGGIVNDFTATLLGFLVLIVPLFSLPFVMKAAGGILERFGAITNNRSKGVVDRSRKMAQESQARTKGKRASNYDPTRTGFARRKNFTARLANRPFLGATQEQRARARFMVAQRGDQYEGEQTKLAAATLSQRGINGDKHALYDIAASSRNNKFLRRAAALQMGEIGAADKLEDLYAGKADKNTGVRSGVDTEQKRMAAYAIGVHSSKLAGPANPLFFDAVSYESSMKKGMSESASISEGQKIREQKVTSQMGSAYLAGLKADQIVGARKTIEGISDAAQKTAATGSVETALRAIASDQRILNNMTDEQVVETGKMASRLGIASTDPTLRPLAERYGRAANAAIATHNSGSKPIDPHEMPTVNPAGGW